MVAGNDGRPWREQKPYLCYAPNRVDAFMPFSWKYSVWELRIGKKTTILGFTSWGIE